MIHTCQLLYCSRTVPTVQLCSLDDRCSDATPHLSPLPGVRVLALASALTSGLGGFSKDLGPPDPLFSYKPVHL